MDPPRIGHSVGLDWLTGPVADAAVLAWPAATPPGCSRVAGRTWTGPSPWTQATGSPQRAVLAAVRAGDAVGGPVELGRLAGRPFLAPRS
ncbi:MAG: hypothetical protein ACRDPY_11275 [Streptosporangiaceae bacterium]